MDSFPRPQALQGVRVLELGQLIAGPFAGCLLGAYGAEVIKVEPPKIGDPMRGWRKTYEGTSLWWYSIARNKKSITLDLRRPEGQELLKRLVAQDVDILIENFRPGRMEEWGLGYDVLSAINPKLIMLRISGWGQDGPYAKQPGFASVAEGVSGLRYVTGEPGRAPVRTGVSLGDTLAGFHAAYGALMALYHRDVNGGKGQVVDVAIYESVFNMMESMLSEYDVLGFVREPAGSRLQGIVPSSTYRCADGKYIIIGANGDSIFKRLMHAIGRVDLASDPGLEQNPGRVAREAEINEAIEAFTLQHAYEKVVALLAEYNVPAGPIYSIADIVKDPQYLSRQMFESMSLPDGKAFKLPRIVPRLSETDSATHWIGPKLGEHNKEVFAGLLGLSADEIAAYSESGVM